MRGNAAMQFSLLGLRQLGGIRLNGNAISDVLDELNMLVNGQLQVLGGGGRRRHGRKYRSKRIMEDRASIHFMTCRRAFCVWVRFCTQHGAPSLFESNLILRKRVAQAAQLERVNGIEPSYAAWEAAVLPLNYTRLV